ncbi:hypothetical protein B0I35DRAFT_446829 [Stachybotrys elegans]|uniref:Uncharacterized protein n=1 Tax=Stachybotrys elegans TaxID=80388 RepID=A0A8K0SDB2_9HYPO|nr:hypothetical protein B0I35DRAFT_446829 [Stachybotrys elegans]
MVLITGAAVGAIATFPPAVALLGPAGAVAAGGAAVPAAAAATGVGTAGAGAAVVALGEGAVVATGVIGSGGSGAAGIALATMVGPIGWAVVGCDQNDDHDGNSNYTWDCWKPIVRDTSTQPSCGLTLRSLAAHPNVQSMTLDQTGILVGNIFGEHFRLAPVNVKGALAFHASVLVV